MNKLIKNRLEKTLKRIWFNLSCYASTNQVAQSPIQCDLEQFLGWGTHSLGSHGPELKL